MPLAHDLLMNNQGSRDNPEYVIKAKLEKFNDIEKSTISETIAEILLVSKRNYLENLKVDQPKHELLSFRDLPVELF